MDKSRFFERPDMEVGETLHFPPIHEGKYTVRDAHCVRSMMRRHGLKNGAKYKVWLDSQENFIGVTRLNTQETSDDASRNEKAAGAAPVHSAG